MKDLLDPRKVFVVHGRNGDARKAMFQFLRSIGLHPLEWSEVVRMTGKATPYFGEILEKAFSTAQAAIILFTPDDEARLRKEYRDKNESDSEAKLKGQPIQNVIFEAGMAMGLFPERTILVELGELRPINAIKGRHVIKLNNSVETRQELANKLLTAGCDVNLVGIDWHDEGDFEAAIIHEFSEIGTDNKSEADFLNELGKDDLKVLKFISQKNPVGINFLIKGTGIKSINLDICIDKLKEVNFIEIENGDDFERYYCKLTQLGRLYLKNNNLV